MADTTLRVEAERAVLKALYDSIPPYIDFESALWGASSALILMRAQPAAERLQSAHAWAAAADVMIVDPDGWRKHAPLGERSMDDPITEAEFTERLSISTIGPAGWLVTPSRTDRQPPTSPTQAKGGQGPAGSDA